MIRGLTFGILCLSSLSAVELIFTPERIDRPRHDPRRATFWYGPFSEGAAVFDVNGDGNLDITCGGAWYEGPAWTRHDRFRDHAFAQGEFVNNCGEYAIDVNRDGRLDLVSAGWMANGVYWYENPGQIGTRWKATKIVSSDNTEGLIVEDIDADGDDDVLINHWSPTADQGVTWLELLDEARFAVHVVGKEGDYHGIGLGDLNRDGRKDIVTPAGWYEAPEIRWSGTWEFHSDYVLPSDLGIRMLVIDVNGDGLNDIIFGHGHDYGLGWLEQIPPAEEPQALAFSKHDRDTDGGIEANKGQFHTLVLADINQDGELDLVTGKRLRGHAGSDPSAFDPLGVFWYEIQAGRFKPHVLAYNQLLWDGRFAIESSPPVMAIGTGMNINVVDIDHDGLVDIVVAGKSGLYLFRNRSVEVSETVPAVAITFPQAGAVYALNQLAWLQGFGYSGKGALDDNSLVWESSRDGVLGVGDDLRLTTLSEGIHRITLTATDAEGHASSETIQIEVLDQLFRRGDTNADGSVDISDAVFLLVFLFAGGPAPTCLESGDVNDDGAFNEGTMTAEPPDLSDGIFLLSWSFGGGPAPPAPGPFNCGFDPRGNKVGCDSFPACP